MGKLFENDDLEKIVKDEKFVNCNEKWELVKLKEKGYSIAAIEHCCKEDLGNNPREKFEECLKNFEKNQK